MYTYFFQIIILAYFLFFLINIEFYIKNKNYIVCYYVKVHANSFFQSFCV